MLWLHLTLMEIPWYSFLLEAEWTPGILNVDRRNRLLEKFQGPYQELNSEPPVSWHSASINYSTTCSILHC